MEKEEQGKYENGNIQYEFLSIKYYDGDGDGDDDYNNINDGNYAAANDD